jgi:ribosomal protein S18 acetylase RimI-like enzyme
MEKRPHWFLEMLGVHEDYQRQGLGAKLIKWGTDQ